MIWLLCIVALATELVMHTAGSHLYQGARTDYEELVKAFVSKSEPEMKKMCAPEPAHASPNGGTGPMPGFRTERL